MQSVKLVLRTVGNPNPALGVVGSDEFSADVEKYTQDGYVVQNSLYLGEVKDAMQNAQGYKVMIVLTKDEVEAKATKAK